MCENTFLKNKKMEEKATQLLALFHRGMPIYELPAILWTWETVKIAAERNLKEFIQLLSEAKTRGRTLVLEEDAYFKYLLEHDLTQDFYQDQKWLKDGAFLARLFQAKPTCPVKLLENLPATPENLPFLTKVLMNAEDLSNVSHFEMCQLLKMSKPLQNRFLHYSSLPPCFFKDPAFNKEVLKHNPQHIFNMPLISDNSYLDEICLSNPMVVVEMLKFANTPNYPKSGFMPGTCDECKNNDERRVVYRFQERDSCSVQKFFQPKYLQAVIDLAYLEKWPAKKMEMCIVQMASFLPQEMWAKIVPQFYEVHCRTVYHYISCWKNLVKTMIRKFPSLSINEHYVTLLKIQQNLDVRVLASIVDLNDKQTVDSVLKMVAFQKSHCRDIIYSSFVDQFSFFEVISPVVLESEKFWQKIFELFPSNQSVSNYFVQQGYFGRMPDPAIFVPHLEANKTKNWSCHLAIDQIIDKVFKNYGTHCLKPRPGEPRPSSDHRGRLRYFARNL
jgi:hypothetical protein